VTGAVVVTGAAGLLGRPLVAHLARRGFRVRALVRDPARFAPAEPNIAVTRAELPDAVDEAVFAGADAVVHLAWATRETDRRRSERVNEDGTRAVLAAARRTGVPRFVFVSTVAAAADAPNYYARSKHAMEALCDPGRDLVVRPGQILAPEGRGLFQDMQDAIRRTHAVPVFAGGRQPLQTVHVDDLTEAIARALERDLTGALNVAEPDPVTLREFLRLLAERLGTSCVLVPLPFRPTVALLGVTERLGIPLPLRRESLLAVKGLQRRPVAEDLARLGVRARGVRESLAQLLPAR
jgi:nucleoside-diphosphate-sugar epimerase